MATEDLLNTISKVMVDYRFDHDLICGEAKVDTIGVGENGHMYDHRYRRSEGHQGLRMYIIYLSPTKNKHVSRSDGHCSRFNSLTRSWPASSAVEKYM